LCRWLDEQHLRLAEVDTAVLLRFLTSCQGLAAATVNRRLAAISGLFTFRAMRDPAAINPMPRGPAGRRVSASRRSGLLGHLARPQPRSPLRARQPQRLPRGLEHAEVNAFLSSLRTWRDKAIAGLMLFSGLRSAEVLALEVADVDVGAGWARVAGKGGRERRAPLDSEVAGWIQAYLLAERLDTQAGALFVVAKGPHRGQRLTGPLQEQRADVERQLEEQRNAERDQRDRRRKLVAEKGFIAFTAAPAAATAEAPARAHLTGHLLGDRCCRGLSWRRHDCPRLN
jgi:integrase